VARGANTPAICNPPSFTDVKQDGQLGEIKNLPAFHTAAGQGTLPAVSGIAPTQANSDHRRPTSPPARPTSPTWSTPS